MTSKTDFFPLEEFPNGVSFDYPEHFVRLNSYKHKLTMDNFHRGREVGEMIPQNLITQRIAEEFGLTVEQVWEFSMIGNWVSYDRDLNAMSDQERQAHYAEMEEPVTDRQIAELREDGLPNIEQIIEMMKEKSLIRDLETQVLNDLLNETEES